MCTLRVHHNIIIIIKIKINNIYFIINYCTVQVVFVDNLEAMEPPFSVVGPTLQSYVSVFPEKTNAEFVEVLYLYHCLFA